MKNRVMVIPLVAIFALSLAFAYVQIDRELAPMVYDGTASDISIRIMSTDQRIKFDIIEALPQGWVIDSWSVENYNINDVEFSHEDRFLFGGQKSVYAWSFKKEYTIPIILTYSLTPKGEGEHDVYTVWMYPSGFDRTTTSFSVAPAPYCGNFRCEFGENFFNCFIDCGLVYVLIFAAVLAVFLIIYLSKKGVFKPKPKPYVESPAPPPEPDEDYVEDETEYVKAPAEEETDKEHSYLTKLRQYLKHGIQRGYTINEMACVLEKRGVDPEILDFISSDSELENLEKKLPQNTSRLKETDYLIQRMERAIDKIKKDETMTFYKKTRRR
ncbi:MAG TPA: hypothetical protein ENN30_00700 [Candidatus Woesearchaeota archaeon]|nr:hypothetical protein [Candidatus Woesearchaeota archaeon]